MGIFDFVKNGVRDMAIARPDSEKQKIVYKHPDQNIPMYAQLTVDSDETALFFRDGKFSGVWFPPGRHTLQSSNIPIIGQWVTDLTGGNVFIAEIIFVKTQPNFSIPFGGPLEMMEDPVLLEQATPRVFGEFSFVVADPVRFVIGYHGQRGGETDLDWIKSLFMVTVKDVIGKTLQQDSVPEPQKKTLFNLGGMTAELSQKITSGAPNLEDIGVKVLKIGNFNISFSKEDLEKLREANEQRKQRRQRLLDKKQQIEEAQMEAQANQFQLDQKFGQDSKYVQQLAGNWQNYAAGSAMIGAGQGMAQGGGDSGTAAVGAQMAVGVGMAGMMSGAMAQPQGPQFVPPHMQPQAPMAQATAPTSAGGKVPCPKCAQSVPIGKFCQECGAVLAAPPAKKFCTGCGVELGAAKFCANCGTPAPGAMPPVVAQPPG